MKLLKVEKMFFLSFMFEVITWLVLIGKDILQKSLIETSIFHDIGIQLRSINISWISGLFYFVIGISMMLIVIFGFSRDERKTAHTTRKLRMYCLKDLMDESSDDNVDAKKENQKRKIYNKIIDSMKIQFSGNKAVFSVQIKNLEEQKIFESDERYIIEQVKLLVPNYNFGELEHNKMIGYRCD